jgi:hypothetical protein
VVIIEFDITLEIFQQSSRAAGIHPVYKQAVACPDRTGEEFKRFRISFFTAGKDLEAAADDQKKCYVFHLYLFKWLLTGTLML